MVEKMQAACPRRAPAGRPPPAAVRHPRRQRLENRARRGRARFVDATLAFLGGLVSPAELLPAARQARPRPCPPPGAGVAARAAPRAADAHRTGWRGPGRPPHWPARPGELRARAAQARERMLARVVADALQRELAAPPPSGDPGVVLARALRLAADACALAAAMPALDDYTALRARRAPRSAPGGRGRRHASRALAPAAARRRPRAYLRAPAAAQGPGRGLAGRRRSGGSLRGRPLRLARSARRRGALTAGAARAQRRGRQEARRATVPAPGGHAPQRCAAVPRCSRRAPLAPREPCPEPAAARRPGRRRRRAGRRM